MSETQQKLIDSYLEPLLRKAFPGHRPIILPCENNLDVMVSGPRGTTRISYEAMRDLRGPSIISAVCPILAWNSKPQQNQVTDYLDGRLHPQVYESEVKAVRLHEAIGKFFAIISCDYYFSQPQKNTIAQFIKQVKALEEGYNPGTE